MPVLKTYKNGAWVEVDGVSGHTHTKDDILDFLNEIYVQNDEPINTDDGTLWLDTDEENIAVSRGKSAYEYAVDGGFKGTEEEFARQMANPYATAITDDGDGNIVLSVLNNITASDDGNGNVVLK